MSEINFNNFLENFKRVYESKDVLQEQQNLEAQHWSLFEDSGMPITPQGIWNAAFDSGDESGGAMYHNGTFDDNNDPALFNPVIMPRYNNFPIRINKALKEMSENNKAAFSKAMDGTVMDRRARCFKDLDRQSMGTGTGQISLANGAGVASTALVVDDALQFRVNMYIDAYTALGGTKEIDSIRITNVDLSTSTLTLASAQTWSDNDIISKAGKLDGVTAISDAKEITGFRGICDTTTYSTTFENIAVATYPSFQGIVITASAPISQDLLRQLHVRITTTSGVEPDTLVSGNGQYRTFTATELQKTRYEAGQVKAGVTETIKWDKLTWKVIWDYPRGEVAMFKKDKVKKYQSGDLHLSDNPAGGSFFQVQNKDEIGAYFTHKGNLGVWRRNALGRMIDLDEPTF